MRYYNYPHCKQTLVYIIHLKDKEVGIVCAGCKKLLIVAHITDECPVSLKIRGVRELCSFTVLYIINSTMGLHKNLDIFRLNPYRYTVEIAPMTRNLYSPLPFKM